jgi:hypothetical protein
MLEKIETELAIAGPEATPPPGTELIRSLLRPRPIT